MKMEYINIILIVGIILIGYVLKTRTRKKRNIIDVKRFVDIDRNKLMNFINKKNKINNSDLYRISKAIIRKSKKYNINPYIITGIIYQESNFEKKARGSSGEKGLMQLMPIALQEVKNRNNDFKKFDFNNIDNIESNIEVGTYFFKICQDLGGNNKEGLKVYNGWTNYNKKAELYSIQVREKIKELIEFMEG